MGDIAMARGRPDWNTAVNIVGQDLAQVIERPMYGASEFASYSDTIAEDGYDTLFSITGKGMIYGGTIYHLGAFNTNYIYIAPEIDGVVMTWASVHGLLDWQIEDESMYVCYDKYYSVENAKYINGISRGITFETSFLIGIINIAGSGAADAINAELWYALI